MTGYSELILACCLDLAVGDPVWLPHPVKIIGLGIVKIEAFLRYGLEKTEHILKKNGKHPMSRRNFFERLAGVLLVLIIVGATYSLMAASEAYLLRLSFAGLDLISTLLMVYLISTTLAIKGLIDSVREVIKPVKKDIEAARRNLGRIVGRDTGLLDEKGILKAAIESLAENASDGIIAPLFYFVIGGLPLAMAYKAINTLDSMVGYRNDRYKYFGWTAARLDDIANFIPARLTGLLIVISSFIIFRSLFIVHRSLKTMFRDGRKHLSPNSGFPEAAIAGVLKVRLGGPSIYGGVLVEKPYIGTEETNDYLTASEKAVAVIRVASIAGACLAAAILFMRYSL